MNSKYSKISDSHRLLLNLSNKINLKRRAKYVVLSNLSIYYKWKNIKKSKKKNNNLKISAPLWNVKFELPDGQCSVLDIRDYFKYMFNTPDNPPIR